MSALGLGALINAPKLARLDEDALELWEWMGGRLDWAALLAICDLRGIQPSEELVERVAFVARLMRV